MFLMNTEAKCLKAPAGAPLEASVKDNSETALYLPELYKFVKYLKTEGL